MSKLLDKINGKRLIVYSFILLVIYAGIKIYNRSSLFVDKTISKENYLAYEDYQLYGYDDGLQKSKANSIFNNHLYEFDYHSDEDPTYITSKGISVGATFDEFLKAYGNYFASGINAHEKDYEGVRDDAYYDSHYVSVFMKPNDYKTKYLDSDVINIEKNEITITYTLRIKGNKIYFSQKDYGDLLHIYYGSNWPQGSIFNPEIQEYSLNFIFVYNGSELILEYLSTDKYIH